MRAEQIAPDMEQISVNGRIISAEFGDTKIEFECDELWGEEWSETLKQCFQLAIAFSSRPWQLEAAMARCNVPGKAKVTESTPAV